MFNKKCPRCKNKTSRSYEYCPYCSYPLKRRSEEDKGLIDKDLEDEFGFGGFEGFGGFPFGNIINGLAKELDRQLKEVERHSYQDTDSDEHPEIRGEEPGIIREGISISISSNDDGEPKINIRKLTPRGIMKPVRIERAEEKVYKKIPKVKLDKKEFEKLAKLPQTEPSTTVRRLANKIIYEIDIPGVKEKDIIIHKLHNSIEIKAFTKDRLFLKLIPVSLPLMDYRVEKGKLVLELKPEM